MRRQLFVVSECNNFVVESLAQNSVTAGNFVGNNSLRETQSDKPLVKRHDQLLNACVHGNDV